MKVKDPAMIRRWRQQERFTQRDLAALVRRSQTTIYLLETGGMKTLTEDLAISIASRLHVPWEVLFELEEHEVMPIVTHEAQVTGNAGRGLVPSQHSARLARPAHPRRRSA
ncbi:helix-turn-helix transcriptional regulator [Pseudarthrobacter cellobiosi]|uniref:helix-turn-helix transcriptional regulator n=1 Tax=Pseudarthrobacter cellobiosi TaxID=2953654 RepID=UPI00208F3928|nr:helix-turn-helix transcriptional regulator [Pseudarthrobacter sp. HLT1-5]MCO4256480.1 helix-turn-helix domain-containing protein [Pseudarthrobacter sp. HLT1-5]